MMLACHIDWQPLMVTNDGNQQPGDYASSIACRGRVYCKINVLHQLVRYNYQDDGVWPKESHVVVCM